VRKKDILGKEREVKICCSGEREVCEEVRGRLLREIRGKRKSVLPTWGSGSGLRLDFKRIKKEKSSAEKGEKSSQIY